MQPRRWGWRGGSLPPLLSPQAQPFRDSPQSSPRSPGSIHLAQGLSKQLRGAHAAMLESPTPRGPARGSATSTHLPSATRPGLPATHCGTATQDVPLSHLFKGPTSVPCRGSPSPRPCQLPVSLWVSAAGSPQGRGDQASSKWNAPLPWGKSAGPWPAARGTAPVLRLGPARAHCPGAGERQDLQLGIRGAGRGVTPTSSPRPRVSPAGCALPERSAAEKRKGW